jgi:hypothetical protein
MRRTIFIVAALGVALAAGSGPASGAVCPPRLTWHKTQYRAVVTHAPIPIGSRLGKATVVNPCSTTHTATPAPGGGYGAAAVNGEPGVSIKRVVYTVDGLRPQVAIVVRSRKPTLFVSRMPETAAERMLIQRLVGR